MSNGACGAFIHGLEDEYMGEWRGQGESGGRGECRGQGECWGAGVSVRGRVVSWAG